MKRGAVAVIERQRNRPAIRRLESLGYAVVSVPGPMIEPRTPTRMELSFLGDPGQFDLVLFLDPISVERFSELAESEGIDVFEYDRPVICALGEAVADGLRFIQLHSDIIPASLVDGAVARSLIDFAGGETALAGQRALVIGSVREAMPPGVSLDLFGEVRSVWLSELKSDSIKGHAKIKALLAGGAIDAVFVSSAFDLVDLRVLTRAYGLEDLGSGPEIFCSNELIQAALTEVGLAARVL